MYVFGQPLWYEILGVEFLLVQVHVQCIHVYNYEYVHVHAYMLILSKEIESPIYTHQYHHRYLVYHLLFFPFGFGCPSLLISSLLSLFALWIFIPTKLFPFLWSFSFSLGTFVSCAISKSIRDLKIHYLAWLMNFVFQIIVNHWSLAGQIWFLLSKRNISSIGLHLVLFTLKVFENSPHWRLHRL